MITAGDFRNGVTFEMDGQVMQVVEFQHVKPGKGAAFVRTNDRLGQRRFRHHPYHRQGLHRGVLC